MAESLQLPIIDLNSPDRLSTARAVRQACVEVGFFYLINHGIEEDLFNKVFEQSKKFFSLPLEEKMKLLRRNHRGYTPLYAENLNPSSSIQGDSKENFDVCALEDQSDVNNMNQWPAEEILPFWRSTMEDYQRRVTDAGIRLISLVALALELDEDFFYKAGGYDSPNVFLRLLHYIGDLPLSKQVVYGASAHSDYGVLTLLAADGVGGLQVCRDKLKQPQIWEDVHHLSGAFIVNIGDLMERWTNFLFRSTLHRVMPTGKERYSLRNSSLCNHQKNKEDAKPSLCYFQVTVLFLAIDRFLRHLRECNFVSHFLSIFLLTHEQFAAFQYTLDASFFWL